MFQEPGIQCQVLLDKFVQKPVRQTSIRLIVIFSFGFLYRTSVDHAVEVSDDHVVEVKAAHDSGDVLVLLPLPHDAGA